ncbi:MAG: hypothetical protein ACHQ7M_23030, partial [Chloroflexota bacterium]
MIRDSGQQQLYDYLAGEVFERQTQAIQRFLLASSILDDMEPGVAGPLAGMSRADNILCQLEEGNLFVSKLEGRKHVYRYHQLFRDFLRSRVDEGAHGLARPDLERRAGALYQQRGQHEQAIAHLLSALAFEEASASILEIAEGTFDRGRLDTLAGWIDRLPEELRLAQPRLALWRARVAVERGEHQAAVDSCLEVEAAGDGALAVEAIIQRAEALRRLGEAERAIALGEQALTMLGPDTPRQRALALRTMSLAERRLGQLALARTHASKALALLDEAGDDVLGAQLQEELGMLAVLLGALKEGRERFSLAAGFWDKSGQGGRLALTLCELGNIAYLEEHY